MRFDFPAALLGSDRSPDLIVVVDGAVEKEARILQKVEGLARALDVMNSKRPLTLVMTGPRPLAPAMDGLARVCRVLGVGDASDADALRDALSVLLPLEPPTPSEEPDEGRLPNAEEADDVVAALLEAAPGGADAVKARLIDLIEEPFEDGDAEQAL
jgi:hypothetical protein